MTKEERSELERSIVYENKDSAVIKLNTLTIEEGEIIKLKYYTDSGKIDVLCAIGVDDGVGPDCYSLVSDQGTKIFNEVVDRLPDVTDLLHGEIYIYKNAGERVYSSISYNKTKGERVIEDLEDSFYFLNLKDSKYYYYDSKAPAIIDIAGNLTEKANFTGIESISLEDYVELAKNNGVEANKMYLINDGTNIVNIYYNGRPVNLGGGSGSGGSGVDSEIVQSIVNQLSEIQNSLKNISDHLSKQDIDLEDIKKRLEIQEDLQEEDSWEEIE